MEPIASRCSPARPAPSSTPSPPSSRAPATGPATSPPARSSRTTSGARGPSIHLGVRTPRDLPEAQRAEVEEGAATSAAVLARAVGARRLVHVSTVAVYGRPRNLPCREGEIKEPRTAHERIRWRAEQASWRAFRAGAPLTVLRPSILYGPTLRGGPVRALALWSSSTSAAVGSPSSAAGRWPTCSTSTTWPARWCTWSISRTTRAVVGRAFNVADEAPLPLAEHLEAALVAARLPARADPADLRRASPARSSGSCATSPIACSSPRSTPGSRGAGRRSARRAGVAPALTPRVDREALHWMAADHYYDTGAPLGARMATRSTRSRRRPTPRPSARSSPASSSPAREARPARLVDGRRSPEVARQRDRDVAGAGRPCHSAAPTPATRVAIRDGPARSPARCRECVTRCG